MTSCRVSAMVADCRAYDERRFDQYLVGATSPSPIVPVGFSEAIQNFKFLFECRILYPDTHADFSYRGSRKLLWQPKRALPSGMSRYEHCSIHIHALEASYQRSFYKRIYKLLNLYRETILLSYVVGNIYVSSNFEQECERQRPPR